jgi:hypothetical protein
MWAGIGKCELHSYRDGKGSRPRLARRGRATRAGLSDHRRVRARHALLPDIQLKHAA